MDKNDLHDDQVGRDLNPSHEAGLPPIWDNIAQELDAFDEMDIPASEEAIDANADMEGADFSFIKDGFQQHFLGQQPPKFMWDEIEQDLESLTETDANADFSVIKEGFELAYKETSAPGLSWADLEEEMDNPTPKVKEEDYSFVKTGFEKQYSTAVVVPLFTWNDLAQRMDDEAALADTPDRYSIIKESFEQYYKTDRPTAAAWTGISHQLRLETAFGRFTHNLTTALANMNWSRNAMLLGVVGLLIGGGRACMFDETVDTAPLAKTVAFTDEENPIEHIYPNDNIIRAILTTGVILEENATNSNEEQPLLLNSGTTSSDNKTANTPSKTNAEQGLLAVAENPADLNEKNPLEVNGVAVEDNQASNEKEETPASTALASNNIDQNANTATTVNNTDANAKDLNTASTDVQPTTAKKSKTSTQNSNAFFANGAIPSAKTKHSTILQETETQFGLFSSEQEQNWLGEQSIAAVVAKEKDGLPLLVQQSVDDQAVYEMEEASFPFVMQSQKKKKLRFEAGLIAKAGTSLFLGKMTSAAFNENSLTSTQTLLTGGVGVNLHCFVGVNDAIVIGVSPYSTAKQEFSRFTASGDYVNQKLNLSYVDLTVGYQKTLFRYNNLTQLPSKVYARFDAGLTYLTDGEVLLNNEVVAAEEAYNRFNLAFGLSLGNVHEWNQFVFDYGVFGNVAALNSINPANTLGLEPAHLLNVGAFVGVRYSFYTKLKVSKRMRQFDWSPPFYIEEPID